MEVKTKLTGLALRKGEVTFVVCVQLVHKVRVSDYFVQSLTSISHAGLTALCCLQAVALLSTLCPFLVCLPRS